MLSLIIALFALAAIFHQKTVQSHINFYNMLIHMLNKVVYKVLL